MKVETVGCVLSQATATALQPPGLLPLLPAAATAGYLLLLLNGLTSPATATTYPAAATYCSWRTCAAAGATTGCGGGPAAGATSGCGGGPSSGRTCYIRVEIGNESRNMDL